jgi:hypothetical protein
MIPNKIRRGQERAKFDFSRRFLHSWPRPTRALEPPLGRAIRRREVSTVAKGMGMKKEKKKPKKKK